MTDQTSNPNLEWKKGGFEAQEKLTLKVNVSKAVEYEAKRKNNLQKAASPRPADLPKNLNKIRKKIKDVFDEEEEDENNYVVSAAPASLEESSLLNALNTQERRQLRQQETLNVIKSQQEAEKADGIVLADKIAREIGLKGLNKETIARSNAETGLNVDTTSLALQTELQRETRIKYRKISDRDMVNFLRGVKRLKAMGGEKAIEGLKMEEVVKAGGKEVDDKKLAKMILEKSGRLEKRKKTPAPQKSRTPAKIRQKDLQKRLHTH